MQQNTEIENATLAEVFSGFQASYNAAKTSRHRRRRTGVSASGSGADYHYRSQADYLRMMEEARDMDRNDMVLGQAIDRAVTETIGSGFTFDPNTGDTGLDTALLDHWTDWRDDPYAVDVAGELTFPAVEEMVFRHAIVDGDIGVLTDPDGPLQCVEAHRIRTPRRTKRSVIHGILVDNMHRRLEMWVTKQDVDPNRGVDLVGDIHPFPMRDPRTGIRQVFHVYNPKRVSQTRGVTALAPMFDLAGMAEDINYSYLVAQQVVSCFAILREIDVSVETPKGAPVPTGSVRTETLSDGTTRRIAGIAPGMEVTGRPGEKLKMSTPGVPSVEFFRHMRMILTFIGINLGLPLVMLLLDGSETNFSGWRGAVDVARGGFRRNQRSLIRRFHKPHMIWRIHHWAANDASLRRRLENRDPRGVDVLRHDWKTPGWRYIEPLKDTTATLLQMRNGMTSRRRLHAERGEQWDRVSTEIVEDNSLAIVKAREAADKLNEGVKNAADLVTWREVLNAPTPDGINISIQPDVTEGGSNDQPNNE